MSKKTKTNEQQWELLVLSLKEIAKKKGVSQQEIANRTGKLRTNVNRVFNLVYCPKVNTVTDIANALDVTLTIQEKES